MRLTVPATIQRKQYNSDCIWFLPFVVQHFRPAVCYSFRSLVYCLVFICWFLVSFVWFLFVRSSFCSVVHPSFRSSFNSFVSVLTCQPARSAANSIPLPLVRMHGRSSIRSFIRSFVRSFVQSVRRSVGQSVSWLGQSVRHPVGQSDIGPVGQSVRRQVRI